MLRFYPFQLFLSFAGLFLFCQFTYSHEFEINWLLALLLPFSPVLLFLSLAVVGTLLKWEANCDACVNCSPPATTGNNEDVSPVRHIINATVSPIARTGLLIVPLEYAEFSTLSIVTVGSLLLGVVLLKVRMKDGSSVPPKDYRLYTGVTICYWILVVAVSKYFGVGTYLVASLISSFELVLLALILCHARDLLEDKPEEAVFRQNAKWYSGINYEVIRSGYIANKRTNVLHSLRCRRALDIAPSNRLHIVSEEATATYRACQECAGGQFSPNCNSCD